MTAVSRWFVADASGPRARRASDVTNVVLGLLLLAVAYVWHSGTGPFEQAVADLAAAMPGWAVGLATLTYTLGALYTAAVLVALLLAGRSHRRALRDVVLAVVLGAGACLLILWAAGTLWPTLLPELSGGTVRSEFPVTRLTVVTAVLITAGPHLARPMRRLGGVVVGLVVVSALVLGLGDVAGVAGGLGLGLAAAGAVLLAFGSPEGYPDPAAVAEGLAALGTPLVGLRVDPGQSWGVRRLVGALPDGRGAEVKAYGRDATESQIVAKVWHALLYRGGWQGFSLSRLQAVEHEALVTLLAARTGAAVPEVLEAARISDEVAVLAVTRRGQRLCDLDPADVDDAALTRVWRDVARLHDASIAHRGLDTTAVMLDGPEHVIVDLDAGTLVASDADRALDLVELLFSTAALLGPDRALAAAREGIGDERLASALPYLQLAAVSTHSKRAASDAKGTMAALRTGVLEATGEDEPPQVKLRRLSVRDALTLVVLGLFVSALVPVLAGVDYAALWEELQSATWWIVAVAFVLAWAVFASQAASMMFAVGRSLPARPTYILEVATTFISFAIPGVAGRVAMNTAYLHRFGVAPGTAVTQGAIDGFAGFLTQCVLLVTAFLTGAVSLSSVQAAASSAASPSASASGSAAATASASASATASASASAAAGSTSSGSVPWGLIVLVVVALAVGTVIAVTRVPKLRDRIVPIVRDGWSALRDVLRSPGRALGLFGANLVTELIWGLILWLSLLALGFHLPFLSAVVVVVATSLLQGLIPVPGGIGVSEAVMTAFLVPLGVPSDVAMAATILWRLMTFYLPACAGFFAMRWLQGHDYI